MSLQALYPANPFYTDAYVAALEAAPHCTAVPLSHAGFTCLGFLRRGLFQTHLRIPSLPAQPPTVFFQRLATRCRLEHIDACEIQTFGSPSLMIPTLACECNRHCRTEYVLDLTAWNERAVADSHRGKVKKARRYGVLLKRGGSVVDHVRLVQTSLARRGISFEDSAEARQLLRAGAGELFQAVHQGEVVASALLLKARCGAYYHTAGNSDAGRALGASHFLIAEAAAVLQKEGRVVLNLGGAAEPGLAFFKRQFSAQEIKTETVSWDFTPVLRRVLFTVAKHLHHAYTKISSYK